MISQIYSTQLFQIRKFFDTHNCATPFSTASKSQFSGSQSLNGVNPQAEDLDVSFPSPVRYSIIDDPEHYFKISATTGVLTVITMRSEGLDRECNHCADGKYTLKLEACDNQK